MIISGILFNSWSITKEKETRNLEKFDRINIKGSIELRLQKESYHSMQIKAKNASDIANLITEVCDGELFIYHEKKRNNWKTPKYIIYLNYLGISDLTFTGVIKLISKDVIRQKDLVISGNGVLNGNIKVLVKNLSVNLVGISNISISGITDVANLNMSGIGMINAKNLVTNSTKKRANGIATVRLPSN